MPSTDTVPVARTRPWVAIIAAGLLILPLGSIYAFSVFLKPLEALLGASRSELATVFGIAAICYTLGMNIGPRLFASLGVAGVLALATAIGAAGIGMASLARSFPELAVGYGVLFGIGGGIGFVAMQQGVNLMGMRRSGLVNGYLVSLLPCGAMLAAPTFGWGIAEVGVRLTLAALAAVLVVSGLLTIGLARYAGMRLAAPVPAAAAGPVGSIGATKPGRPDLFWKLFGVFFMAASSGLMVLSQAAGIVAAYGGATALALAATTGLTAGITLARLAGGLLVDRIPVPVVMAGAQVLALAGAVAVTLWPTAETSVAALLAVGVGYGIISGSTAAAIACYWPKALYGRVASRIYIAWCAAAVVLPILAARLFDLTGGYRTAFMIAGAGSLVAALAALTLPRQEMTG